MIAATVVQPAIAADGPRPPHALALELLDEKDWVSCRRECLRLTVEMPESLNVQCIAELARRGAGLAADPAKLAAARTNLNIDAAVRLRLQSTPERSPRVSFVSRLAAATGLPGRWLVAFYQTQIGPAIGQRCQMKPSCSEYARQALVRHGLLGIPLIADRLVREPSIAEKGRRTVTIRDVVFICDSVSDHDYWWSNAVATERNGHH
jgi:putative component of membrane protein insertase Oxa1/YidC/SpoIIIJ protein YidD